LLCTWHFQKSVLIIDHLFILCNWSCFVESKILNFWGQQQVFTPLLSDQGHGGIVLENGETVRGTVIAIAGDNLGSHSIWGFTENFSKSRHFWCYCLKQIHVWKQRHSVKSNKNKTELSKQCGNRVVSTDLALYIKQLVTVGKHFSYVQLNRNISSFKYCGCDMNNMPCEVKPDGGKLTGHAAQNWCLLRLLPLPIGYRIKKIYLVIKFVLDSRIRPDLWPDLTCMYILNI